MDQKAQLRFLYSMVRYQSEEVPSFRELVNLGYLKQMEQLTERVNNYLAKYPDGDTDHYADEAHFAEQGIQLGNRIYVIALVMDLEIFLKKVLSYIYKVPEKGLYRFEDISSAYKVSANIVLGRISSFNSVNEIKEIANCLKHSGYVSKKLNKISRKKWPLHERIEISDAQLDRFEVDTKRFRSDLLTQVHEYIASYVEPTTGKSLCRRIRDRVQDLLRNIFRRR